MMTTYDVNTRNKLLRLAKRADYEVETINAIVDAALIGHVAYAIDGQPYAVPTLVARDGDTILLHGHAKARTLLHAGAGNPVCITVTHTDGIVLARSVFNHSINYRSAMIYGVGRLITDRDEKLDALRRFTEKLLPGRWDDTRPTTEQELLATAAVAVPIENASAKIRTGMPADEPEDIALPYWAGIVPMRTVMGAPEPDQHVPDGTTPPDYLERLIAENQ